MRLLLSTGEVSGDLQGGLLVKSLKKEARKRSIDLEIVAFGGKRMKEAGALLLADTSSIDPQEVIDSIKETFTFF